MSDKQLEWCRRLPKVELHAHLNGSVQDDTLRQLHAAQGASSDVSEFELQDCLSKGQRTLQDCFKLFDIIHRLTTTPEAVTRITREVILDFADDQVLYLELRTTPKNRPNVGMTKASYTQAVLAGMAEAHAQLQQQGRWMMVKLLLSIDRREDQDAAMETVQLAAQLLGRGVVGVDLSGNPVVGSWGQWEPALTKARQLGLRVTLHGGEVDAPDEVDAMLAWRPDRFGHMCCLSSSAQASLLSSGVPLELCLTSNLKTATFDSLAAHHFSAMHAARHPVCLCTDDSGVFGTSLSQEYALAQQAFGLTGTDLKQLALQAVHYVFASELDKAELANRMQAAMLECPYD